MLLSIPPRALQRHTVTDRGRLGCRRCSGRSCAVRFAPAPLIPLALQQDADRRVLGLLERGIGLVNVRLHAGAHTGEAQVLHARVQDGRDAEHVRTVAARRKLLHQLHAQLPHRGRQPVRAS